MMCYLGYLGIFYINLKTYNKKCPELRGNYRVILLLQPARKLWLPWNKFSPTANCSPRLLSAHHPVATYPPAHLVVTPEKYQEPYFAIFLNHTLQNELQQRSRHDYKCHASEHGKAFLAMAMWNFPAENWAGSGEQGSLHCCWLNICCPYVGCIS